LESIVDLVNELFVVKIASTDNHKVVTKVVSSLVVSEVITSQVGKNVSITPDWLAKHVVTVSIEVRVLKSGVMEVSCALLVLNGDFLLKEFKFCRVESGTRNGVTEQLDSTVDIALENRQTKASLLASAFSVKACTEGVDLFVEGSTGV